MDEAQLACTPLRVRTVWISDLHLGTPGCQAEALLLFLRDLERWNWSSWVAVGSCASRPLS